MNDGKLRIQILFAAAFIGILLPVATINWMRAHVRAARAINTGDSASTVHARLGEPDAVIESIAQLFETVPLTTSYEFQTLDRNPINVNALKFEQAEWFDLGSAGYLVIYKDNVVLQIIWGGT